MCVCSYVPLEGEMCGEAKDQSTLLAHRMTLLSLDQLRLVSYNTRLLPSVSAYVFTSISTSANVTCVVATATSENF